MDMINFVLLAAFLTPLGSIKTISLNNSFVFNLFYLLSFLQFIVGPIVECVVLQSLLFCRVVALLRKNSIYGLRIAVTTLRLCFSDLYCVAKDIFSVRFRYVARLLKCMRHFSRHLI